MYSYTREIPFNFGITKNIPIDTRFLVNNLNELLVKVPFSKRYPGLVFFVSNDTPDHQGNTGFLYIFDNDLQPQKLQSFLNRYTKYGIQLESDADYANIDTILNTTTYPELGTMIYVSPMDVVYVYNGSKFVYFAGDYKFTSMTQYNNLPDAYKQPNAVVYVGNTKYIIKNDLTLSTPLLVYDHVNDIPTPYENDRYYLVNGILHFCFEGVLYSIGNKIFVMENMMLSPNQSVKHDLNTYAVKAYFTLRAVTGKEIKVNPKDANRCMRVGLDPVDLNNSIVANAQTLTGDLYILAMA